MKRDGSTFPLSLAFNLLNQLGKVSDALLSRAIWPRWVISLGFSVLLMREISPRIELTRAEWRCAVAGGSPAPHS